MKERDIYLLDPKELSPEVIAVAFAKTSRSPDSFRDIAAELSDEQSAEFHEKWVVGYGHASVAEHAVLHLALVIKGDFFRLGGDVWKPLAAALVAGVLLIVRVPRVRHLLLAKRSGSLKTRSVTPAPANE